MSKAVPTEPDSAVTAVPSEMEWVLSKRSKLRDTQFRFKKACDQILILNRTMALVLHRYYDARENVNRNFRYKLRLRLAVIEGIRNMYYEYASRKATEIVTLRRDLFGDIVEIVTGDSDDDDDDDYYDADEYEDEVSEPETEAYSIS